MTLGVVDLQPSSSQYIMLLGSLFSSVYIYIVLVFLDHSLFFPVCTQLYSTKPMKTTTMQMQLL